MVSVDVAIRNGMVVAGSRVVHGGLAISDGVIVALGTDRQLPRAAESFDARGAMILPGVIDPHVHLGVGGTADELKLMADFESEPLAAATGGVTCFVTNHEHARGASFVTLTRESPPGRGTAPPDRDTAPPSRAAASPGHAGAPPGPAPAPPDRDTAPPGPAATPPDTGTGMTLLDRAKLIGEQRSVIDFRFTALPQDERHLDEIPALLEQGVTSFKFYPSYLGDDADDFGIKTLDWGFIYEAFDRLARARRDEPAAMAMVHCEEPYICARLKARLRRSDPAGSLAAWADSRPAACEAMQVYDAGLIAKQTGCRLYVVHTSSGEGTDAIAALKSQGADIVGETCTHYLVLTSDSDLGRWAKVNPPIRSATDQERLWRGLRTGALEVVGSDNARATIEEKLAKNFWDAIPGFADMAATLPLLVSEGVLRDRLSWVELARLLSGNPARYYGMYPRKGTLRVGSDGDVVVLDHRERWTLTPASLNPGGTFSIYDGWEVTGRPILTFVRGVLVAEHGKIVGPPGHGRYIASGRPRQGAGR